MTAVIERTVEVAGLRLTLREHPGGGPPVIALHGLASNARWWDLVAGKLSPDHRTIAIDQRGHGLSDKPDRGYSFEACAADVAGVIDTLGLGRVVVAGHSWGASVALYYAAMYPARVAGTICVDGGIADLRAIFGPTWEDAAVAMRPPNLEGITERQLRHWIEMSPLADASDADTGLQILLGNFESDGAGALRPRLHVDRHMEIARHLYELDTDAILAQVQSPVLLIMAALGRGGPAAAEKALSTKQTGIEEALNRLGGRGAVVWIEGEHDLPVQRPDEVATAMAAFIDALPKTSPLPI